jgi:calcineurin-like phosphoesterase family protein
MEEEFELDPGQLPADFYVTSDTWFGRTQILQIANRLNFSTIEEMNATLIKNWNKKVKKDDIVIHLGNFAWDPATARSVLKKLNGKILFLYSNDDEALLEVAEEFDNVLLINEQICLAPNHDIVLSHYPLHTWPGKETGTLHIHGHLPFSHKTNLSIEKRVNACTDFWSYAPIQLSTLKELIDEIN